MVVVVVVLLPPLREPGQMEVLTRQGRTRGLSGPDELVGANRRPGGMEAGCRNVVERRVVEGDEVAWIMDGCSMAILSTNV